ncbi:uncharacterized protein LOC123923622 [Trifolium pratense]|uniref:uncharacterized protein LOC123923622 n=1 Tax=Trifolium pratense TaxID=57577 RepID=UPI001E690E90|nr:uncharacterized protein LOC123923622 [Trifolium pratense]
MNFPFSYLFPDNAESLKSVYQSMGTNPHFEMETIISPYEPKIPLPNDFWMVEKTRLLSEGVGFIRDDYNNYFKVYIGNDGDGGCLYDGSVIAMYCGFSKPQKVILSYQIIDNEFQMKVVDDLGEEVKYLGLLFPEDQQSLRSVVPNCVLQSAFVDTASFEPNVLPQLLLREDGVVFGYNGLDDVPLNIEHPDVDINQEYFHWEVKITKSMAAGRNVLHIPKHIADKCFPPDQNSVVLVNQETEQLYLCAVTTSYPPGRCTRRIGRGWYGFAKDARLKHGDKVVFTLPISPEFVLANIIRCAPGNV